MATVKNYSKSGASNIVRSLFHILLAARTCAVLFSNIWDCDETYNYFEPAHFLIYGFGCQTWEYAPHYALRSYAYLLVHVAAVYVPAVVFFASKVFIFYMIRFVLAMLDVWSHHLFVRAISHHFGTHIANLTLLLCVFSPGYFQASTAFLPSSTAMVLLQFGLAFFVEKHYFRTAVAGVISAVLTWPFSAVLFVPSAVSILFSLKWRVIIFASKVLCCSLVLVVVPVCIIDSIFYGRLVAAALNIFVYNVAGTDESHGSHLYGTAPMSFYLMNLFLNFNFALVFSCFGLMALIFSSKRFYSDSVLHSKGGDRRSVDLVIALTLVIWLAIFFLQPHKEERFLYPVYSLVALTAAIGVQFVTASISRILRSCYRLQTVLTDSIQFGFVGVFILLSLSRCAALYFNYHASMDVYLKFSESVKLPSSHVDNQFNFCVGREWHRAPGHFLLNDNRIRLRFMQSAFQGQLPGHYFENMTIGNATRAVRFDMNDANREEPSHYTSLDSCHFIADLDMDSLSQSKLEPNFAADSSGTWTVLIRMPYLANIDREEITLPAWQSLAKRLLRAFYVPYLSSLMTSNSFRDYVVLQNTALLPLKISH